MSEIQDFYKDRNLFITGGTGFIGKILLEKFLRSFPEIGTIYLLIRSKKNKTIQDRLTEFWKLPMFEQLRNKSPDFEKKIVGVDGDITKSGLGLSAEDRNLITEKVSIIIHGAASTKFNESLKTSVPINVTSVIELINICRECKKLKAAIYLSTAFSQCIYDHIEEKIYPLTISKEELNEAVKFITEEKMSEDEEEEYVKILLGKFPNTYALTKSVAEGVLNENAKDLPFSIFRFSIVLASYREPVPGWVDTVQGFTQAIIGIGLGAIHVIYVHEKKKIDFVPADFTCNALIAAVCETGTKNRANNEDLPVYNYVSGPENPFTMEDFKENWRISGHKNPPNMGFYYPEGFFVGSKKLFLFFNIFMHFLPALIADIFLRLLGRKPILYKTYKKGIKLFNITEFFLTQEWSFENNRVQSLWNNLSEIDKELIPFDIKSINWYNFIEVYWNGIKQYILKDDVSPQGLKRALRKQTILYVCHLILQFFFFTFITWLTWKIFRSINLYYSD